MKHTRFLLAVDVPEGVSSLEMAQYILEAVNGWRGGFTTDHLLFGVNLDLHISRQHRHHVAEESAEAVKRPWGEVVMDQFGKDNGNL